MLNFKNDFSLLDYNTFHINVKAKLLLEVNTENELVEFISSNEYKNYPKLVLGGGSNILFTQDFDGIVLQNNIKGIEVIDEDEDHYFVKVGAGEVWHDFVLYTIDNNMAGLENLSLIPGKVGASPMQNIGAYGVEVKQLIVGVDAIELGTGNKTFIPGEDCEFGYRSSIFKTTLKNKVFISYVTFKLNKTPVFNVSYGNIKEELERLQVKELSIKAISDAVCRIRSSKLPDPKDIGNAGSFFKNPVVSKTKADQLKKEHEGMPVYPVNDSESKIAAGWLIEQCGWKGFRVEDHGVHDKQALVLVNYGTSHGNDIYNLSEEILKSVQEKFGITLEREVNII